VVARLFSGLSYDLKIFTSEGFLLLGASFGRLFGRPGICYILDVRGRSLLPLIDRLTSSGINGIFAK
jgi:hypothetical protein